MASLKIVLLGAWFAALAIAERVFPAAPRPASPARTWRNVALWGGIVLINPLIVVPIGVFASAFDLWTRPYSPLGFALDLVLLDAWTYGFHRAYHEWPLLWRFHRVHHLDETLDATSALRFHPGEVVISALARTPLLVVADISLAAIVIFDALLLASALFHHSNVRLPGGLERALRLVIVTPSHHWVHHHAKPADTNSNYAALLTLWDRLFGSWSPTVRTPHMPIGVENERDPPLPVLLAAPFRT